MQPSQVAGAAIAIPFTLAGATDEPVTDTGLSWKRSGHTYLLSLPAGARADTGARLLTLPLGSGAGTVTMRAAGAAIAAAPAAGRPVVAGPCRGASGPASRRAIDAHRGCPAGGTHEVPRRGVRRVEPEPFLSATGQWKMADGSLGFSGDIGIGLLAESIARGTWQRSISLWTDAVAQQARRVGDAPVALATSTYLGTVRDFARDIDARTASELENVRGLLQKKDASLLVAPDFMQVVLASGDSDLSQKALAFLAELNPAALDMPSSLGLLSGLVDYGEITGANESITRFLREILDKRILLSVSTADSGVYLVTDKAGHCDILSSVRAGSLLLRAGSLLRYSLASAVGRGLVASGVGLADVSGFLPATLSLSGGRIGAREGSLAPESLYTLLPLARLVPKKIPVAAALGPGAWIWTSARLVSAEGSTSDASITLAYPVGIPHHFVIRGVKAFTQIRLHAIPWHTDPTYAKYSDGWAYDAATRTLFVKLTGRTDQESISIHY